MLFLLFRDEIEEVWAENFGDEVLDERQSEGDDQLKLREFDTDTSKSVIPLEEIMDGGPGKDGIPALNDPKFVSISEVSGLFEDQSLGLLVKGENSVKYYPYNILVWHEVVNDEIDGTPILVTFCPLCGSGIVFSRDIEGKETEFGVSGLIYQSNLLMYDKNSETLWSQARGEAVVGELTGTELERLDTDLITFQDLKVGYPNAQILSTDTGHNRDYDYYPYGDYDQNHEIYFPIGEYDLSNPPKSLFYVIDLPSGNQLAISFDRIKDEKSSTIKIDENEYVVKYSDGEIDVSDAEGRNLPGYYTMWFSWSIHNSETGEVWD